MAGYSAISRLKDMFPNLADLDGSKLSAQIVASSDEATSMTVMLSASADGEGVKTTTVTTVEAEADGAKIWSTSDTAASGEKASTSYQGTVSLEEREVVITADAKAEAEGEGATASADTDAGVGPEWSIIAFEQERFETDGDDPTAVSRTYLAADLDLLV